MPENVLSCSLTYDGNGGIPTPRPQKKRLICRLPRNSAFIPACPGGKAARIVLALDEYEAVRLIDLEGCIGCGTCAVVCPEAAMEIVKVEG